MRPVHSPSIRSRYDYFYNMLPASMAQAGAGGHGSHGHFHDNQQADLFGDPIPPPPPTGFVDNSDSELYDPGGRLPNVNYLATPASPYGLGGYTTGQRTRSAMGYEPPSPHRGSSTDLRPPTQHHHPPGTDDWSSTSPRPKSSINRTSTSGTTSDRSPGDYSTPRLLSGNDRRTRTTFQEVSPSTTMIDSNSTISSVPTTAISAGGFSHDVIDERERKSSALRKSREPSPVTVVTDFITTGPYRNFAPGPGMSNYSLPDTRTSNKKPSFSILLDNHRSASFKHLAHPLATISPLHRPHSERQWRGGHSSGMSPPSSSRGTSPTKLYYIDQHLQRHHSPQSTLYRPTTGHLQQHRFVGSVHHSVPDLYRADEGVGGVGAGRFVSTREIPLSSRSNRPSFEPLPNDDEQDMEAYQITTDTHHKTMIQISSPAKGSTSSGGRVNKSYETLSNIVRNEVGLSNSMRDLQKAGSIAKRRRMPPIKTSKGVVHIIDEKAQTKIPRRPSVSDGLGKGVTIKAPFSRTQARASRRGSIAQPPPEEVRSKTPSSRRQSVSRPTTLSPIIGTPNKDSELSAASRSSDRDLVVPDSPSRIPIKSRSSSRGNSITRESSPRKSPMKTDANPPSIIRKTPISVTSNLHRTNAAKKNIPVFGSLRKDGKKPGVKNVPKKSGPEKKIVRRSSSLRSQTSSEEPKRASSRQPSPDKKLKSPSPVKREASPAKREASPGMRDSSPTKRESSPAKREPSPAKAESPKDKKMKRLLTKESFQSKSSDSIRQKSLEKKSSFKKQQSNPDLNKLAQRKSEEDQRSINSVASATSIVGVTKAGEKFKKLVPLTKQNVVSMTTAAVVSQPAQIQTTLTNQLSQAKLADTKRASDESSTTDPVAIIEHSQKTLESIQKTMSDATDEINKTIEENLTHLKDLETAISDSPKPMDKEEKKPHPALSKDSKPASTRDLLKKRMESGTPKGTPKNMPKTPLPPMPSTPKPTVPVEPTVNVIEKPMEPKPGSVPMPNPSAQQAAANAQNAAKEQLRKETSTRPEMEPEGGRTDKPMMNSAAAGSGVGGGTQQPTANNQKSSTTMEESKQKQPPSMGSGVGAAKEGMSATTAAMGGKSLGVGQSGVQTQPPMKSTNNTNGKNNNNAGQGGGGSSLAVGQSSKAAAGQQPRGSTTTAAQPSSSASLTHVDEKPPRKCCKLSKCCDPCYGRLCGCFSMKFNKGVDRGQMTKMQKLMDKMNCCKKKETEKMAEIQTITQMNSAPQDRPPGCCRSFWGKMFCCRSQQKVSSRRSSEMILGDEMETTKCCFCIPCRRKRRQSVAWSEDRQMSNSSQKSLPPQSFCSKLFQNVCCCFCCRRKNQLDSRRTSLNSKKPSLDGRPKEKPKLDHALIEHNSMMKAALPALPICLAYFCLICNIVIPGLGTILSGLFCVCFGKPRFSQIDGARPRIGSLLINIIVGFGQAFCVIFCLVGWGWSIWWGLILLKTAQKLRRIKKAERITADVNAGKKIDFGKHKKHKKHDKHKDVEAGHK